MWWLEIGQTILQEVQLYAPDGNGGYTEVTNALQGLGVNRRIDNRRPLFELNLHHVGEQTYFLRLAAQTSMATELHLWQPSNLMTNSINENFFWGCVFGAYILVIIFYFAYWLWAREHIHIIYTCYVLINFLASFCTVGWPAQLFPNVSPLVWLKVLGVSICMAMFFSVSFGIAFLRLQLRWARASRAITLIALFLSLLCAAAVIADHYREANPLAQVCSMLIFIITMFVTLKLSFEGNKDARFFIFAFSFFYVGVTWRYLRNFGFLEPNFMNDNSYQIGAFVHMLMMSTAIFTSYNRMRNEKQAAEERALAESRLRSEQSEFMAMVSHEFRTPLNIVSASAENLHTEPILPDKQRARVEKIIRATERMTSLMNNYLAQERLTLDSQELQLTRVNLLNLCEKVRGNTDDWNIQIQVQPNIESIWVYSDASLIEIALMNLVTNAHRHNPMGAAIDLELAREGDSLTLCVRDKGPGIPPEELAHIFKRFYRGRGTSEKPGAGIGLHLVRTIIEKHHGQVTVRNLESQGCEFKITLPAIH